MEIILIPVAIYALLHVGFLIWLILPCKEQPKEPIRSTRPATHDSRAKRIEEEMDYMLAADQRRREQQQQQMQQQMYQQQMYQQQVDQQMTMGMFGF